MEIYMNALASLTPEWLLSSETQAVMLFGLCGVGAWVVFTWIIQLMITIMWPFIILTVLMILMPGLRKMLAEDVLPKQLEAIRDVGARFIRSILSNDTVTK